MPEYLINIFQSLKAILMRINWKIRNNVWRKKKTGKKNVDALKWKTSIRKQVNLSLNLARDIAMPPRVTITWGVCVCIFQAN